MLASTVGSLVYRNSSDTFMQRSHSARCRWAEHYRSIAPHPKYLSPNISPFTSLKAGKQIGGPSLTCCCIIFGIFYLRSQSNVFCFIGTGPNWPTRNWERKTWNYSRVEWLKVHKVSAKITVKASFEGCFHAWILTETCSAFHDFQKKIDKLDDHFFELNPTRDIDPCLWQWGTPVMSVYAFLIPLRKL